MYQKELQENVRDGKEKEEGETSEEEPLRQEGVSVAEAVRRESDSLLGEGRQEAWQWWSQQRKRGSRGGGKEGEGGEGCSGGSAGKWQ